MDLKITYVSSSPKEIPTYANSLASSMKLGTYPMAPASWVSSAPPSAVYLIIKAFSFSTYSFKSSYFCLIWL